MWPFSFFGGERRSAVEPPARRETVVVPARSADPVADLARLNLAIDTDEGLPLVDPQAIVGFFRDEILETRYTLGLGVQTFEDVCAPLIEALADWLQTLPATRSDQFRRPLGAMKRAMLTGRACARAGTAVIFDPDASQSERKLLQAHWRVACWSAGVAGELGFLLDQLDVVGPSGEVWRPTSGLFHWGQQRGIDRVWLRWRHRHGPREKSAAADGYLANLVVPKRTLAFLHEGSGEIARVALDAVVGAPSDRGRTLLSLVANARQQIAAMDLDADPVHYGRPILGVVLAEFVVQAMRDCLARGGWTVNERMSAVFHTAHGTYVKWPYAATELRARIAEKRVAPVPDDDDQLLQTLADAGLIDAAPGTGLISQLWTIEPRCCGKPLQAIKLRSAHVLCGERDPWQPIECRVALPRDLANAAPVPPAAPESSVTVPPGKKATPRKPRAEAPVAQPVGTARDTCSADKSDAEAAAGNVKESGPTVSDFEGRVESGLSSPERVCLRRFTLKCWAGDLAISRASIEAAGLPFASVAEVLERLQGATQNGDALAITAAFARYLEETKSGA